MFLESRLGCSRRPTDAVNEAKFIAGSIAKVEEADSFVAVASVAV